MALNSYVKVDENLFRLLDERGVGDDLQLAYIRLASLIHTANFTELTTAQLQKVLRCGYKRVNAILSNLSQAGLVRLAKRNGVPMRLEFLLGVYKGYRECDLGKRSPLSSLPRKEKGSIEYTHREKQPQQSSRGFSFDAQKVGLAKKYIELLQENGVVIRNFPRYLETVVQANDRMGTWDKLPDQIEALNTQIESKKTVDKRKKLILEFEPIDDSSSVVTPENRLRAINTLLDDHTIIGQKFREWKRSGEACTPVIEAMILSKTLELETEREVRVVC